MDNSRTLFVFDVAGEEGARYLARKMGSYAFRCEVGEEIDTNPLGMRADLPFNRAFFLEGCSDTTTTTNKVKLIEQIPLTF